MANNVFQVKRTNTSGRTPNTTGSYVTNSQYIAAGEFALNMADGILYSSNGSAVITVGSNLVNQRITNSLNLDQNKPITFKTVNTAASVSFIQQNDDNFVFYTTNTSYGQRAVWSIFANNNTANLKFAVQTTFNGNLDLNIVAVYANGSPGTAGQVLTTNGQSTYWSTVSGGGSVDVAAQYAWTNIHTFAANVSFNGNGIGIASNTGAIYLGGISDANWRIGRNTGATTKWRYTNNSIDIITANSNLEGMAIGLVGGNSYFETGYLGTYIAANVTIGNSSSNSTINSTGFAFGTSFIANTTGAYHTGTINAASHTVGTAFTANSTVVNAVAYYSGTLLVANSTVSNATHLGGTSAAGYQTTAGLSANVATLTSNNATFMNGNNVLSVMQSLRANRALHGGGTITVSASGDILWSARFIVISNGRGTHFSTEGFFNISCPTSGTITGVGGAANKTATAAGIPLAGWEALYYILPIGSNSGSLAANFRVVNYTSDVEIPSNWLLICAQNSDNGNYYFNNGIILKVSQSFVGGTFTSANMPQANNANNLGGVAAASYVQNTDSRTLSGNLVISGTSFTPSSNTILLGNSTQRWVLSANTGSFSGAVSGITTLAAGNTTLTGWASAQSVIITGGGSYTNGSIYSDANWGMLFRASRGSPTQAQYAWKSSDDVTEYLRISPTGNVGISNTAPDARLAVTGTANISGNFTVGGITTFNANVILGSSGLSANGGFGTAGQVLTTNGTAAYWTAAAGGGYYKGGSAAVGSLAVGGQNIFRVNANTLNNNTTIAAGENAQATGPISVASGITLTVESGARVSIV